MEPMLPKPNLGPEISTGDTSRSQEYIPMPPSPEAALERSEKPVEQQGESTPTAVNVAPVLPPPVVTPLPPAPVQVDDSVTTPLATPIVANDDDLIEKEWVDQAKKIIAQTKDDPHKREREVQRLQADYLMKRYGKELGAVE